MLKGETKNFLSPLEINIFFKQIKTKELGVKKNKY